MGDDRTEAVDALLAETAAAHGVYEEAVLDGVYDKGWPTWYAAYAVEHGMGGLIGRAITADELAQFLATSNAELEKLEPKPSEPWATYTARRIAQEL